MIDDTSRDRAMVEHLLDLAGQRRPAYAEAVIARAVAHRQRPGWTFPSAWLPLAGSVPLGRWAVLAGLLVLGLLGALVASRPPAPEAVAAANGPLAIGLCTQAAGGPQVVLLDVAGGRQVPAAVPVWRGLPLAWDPAGRRLAYLVPGDAEAGRADCAGDRRGRLWVAHADGSGAVAISVPSVSVTTASWSSDGRMLAVSYSDDGIQSRVAIASADGTVHRILDLGGPADGAQWQPHGDRILVRVLRDGHRGLYTVAADDPADLRLVAPLDDRTASGVPAEAAWSPDGQSIAYVRRNPAKASRLVLHVVRADGSDDRPLRVEGAENRPMLPTWSPDGTRLAALADAQPMVALAADGAAGAVGPPPTGHPSDPRALAWAPDGTRLVAGPRHTAIPDAGSVSFVDPRLILIDPASGAWSEVARDTATPLLEQWQGLAWQPVPIR